MSETGGDDRRAELIADLQGKVVATREAYLKEAALLGDDPDPDFQRMVAQKRRAWRTCVLALKAAREEQDDANV